MADERRSARSVDYRAARIGSALSLVFAIVLMLVMDALSPQYQVDPAVLTILGVIVLSLLAVDARDLAKRLVE